MAPVDIGVFGASGFGRELAWLVETCNRDVPRYRLVGFVDDNPQLQDKTVNGLQVMSLERFRTDYPQARLVLGVGDPGIRERIARRTAEMGFAYETVVHPGVERSEWIELGEGTVICAGNLLTTNIRIGRHVHINLDCTIGHDVLIGDCATLSPGVHVSGCVHIGTRAFLGTGAVIVNGVQGNPIVIGDDAVIGAGACVTKSIPAGTTAVGVPAGPVKTKREAPQSAPDKV